MNPALIDILVEIGKLVISAIGEAVKENEQWILISKSAYAIIAVGKNDECVQFGTQKTPEVGSLGLFYSVWARWLVPLADYRYLSPSSHLQM